jgi:polar amino acid transport system permease protein
LSVRGSRYFTASNEPGVPSPSLLVRALNFGIALLAVSLVFCFSFWKLKFHLHWDSIYAYRRMFVQGWLTTIWISTAALAASTLIGFCSALAQRSRFLPLRYLSKIYVELVRGTPLLSQILIFFYVVAPAFNVNDRYLVGILTLAFFSGAYI